MAALDPPLPTQGLEAGGEARPRAPPPRAGPRPGCGEAGGRGAGAGGRGGKGGSSRRSCPPPRPLQGPQRLGASPGTLPHTGAGTDDARHLAGTGASPAAEHWPGDPPWHVTEEHDSRPAARADGQVPVAAAFSQLSRGASRGDRKTRRWPGGGPGEQPGAGPSCVGAGRLPGPRSACPCHLLSPQAGD